MPRKSNTNRYYSEECSRLRKAIERSIDPATGKGYTQRALAEKLNLSDKYISMVVNDVRKLSKKKTCDLAEILSVRKEYLLLLDEYMTDEDKERAEYEASERQRVNEAIKTIYKPLELAEMLIKANRYTIYDDYSDEGKAASVIIVAPSGEKRIISSKDYMRLLRSVNNSLTDRLSCIFAGSTNKGKDE